MKKQHDPTKRLTGVHSDKDFAFLLLIEDKIHNHLEGVVQQPDLVKADNLQRQDVVTQSAGQLR